MKTLDQVDADVAQVKTIATGIDAKAEKRIPVDAANTPGDDTNTFIVSQPGSYYLTGNITGAAGKNGISVQADDVTLDLNGFALIGGGVSMVRGVDVPAAQINFCIRNGSVRGWTNGGVRAEAASGIAEKLRVANNTTGYGLAMGNGSTIRDCEVSGNTTGIYAPDRTSVVNCVSTINTGAGMICTNYVTIINCTASRNGGIGISLEGNDTVSRCTVSRNDGGGIVESSGGSNISECTAAVNTGHGIAVGTGSVVQNCSAHANTGNGISAANACYLTGNKCDANSTGILINAPGGQGGMQNRVDGNSCTNNSGFGIFVNGLSNLIIRNYAAANPSGNYSISGAALNKTGPIVTSNGTISSTSPWANFE